jgi:hypothetical protein
VELPEAIDRGLPRFNTVSGSNGHRGFTPFSPQATISPIRSATASLPRYFAAAERTISSGGLR